MVALMGVNTIQMARNEVEGFEGRWTKNPLVFDNSYYKEILSEKSKYLRLEADEELANVGEVYRNRIQSYGSMHNDLLKTRRSSFGSSERHNKNCHKMDRRNY